MEPEIQVRVNGGIQRSGGDIRFASDASLDPPACNGETIKIRIENIGPATLVFDGVNPLLLSGSEFHFVNPPHPASARSDAG